MSEGISHTPARARVCVVRHSYYPFELNVKREAEALSREGYDVSVICLRGKGEAAEETVNGVQIFRLPVGHKRGKILRYIFEYNAFFLLASIKLLVLHMQHRWDIVQINTMPDALVFVALIPKLMGTKVVLHMHEPVPELFATMFPKPQHAPLIGLIKFWEKISLWFADRALTVTREMRDNFGKRGADINKITVIVNVPDDALFRLEDHQDKLDEIEDFKREERRKGIFRIITHGAIEYRYGPDVVVRAVAHLKERLPGLEFRLLGRGDYLNDVLVLAKQLKVADRVRYLGFLDFDEMIGEVLAADVGLVPMRKNPYSVLVHTNKMYEYVALEKPVIASRLDSTNSYFPDDSIVYFESDDSEDLADKIYSVFSHPEAVEAQVKRASEIYEAYRWQRERRKYLGVYEELTSTPRIQ